MAGTPLDVWLEVAGRLHPVVLHLPIGILAALGLLELWGLLRRRPLEVGTRRALVTLAAGSAVLAAGSGWLLASEPDHGGETLDFHRYLGLALAACTTLAAIGAWSAGRRLYGWALVLALALLGPTGHLGGTMTHGDGFLTAPLRAASEDDARGAGDDGAAPSWYAARIAPILAARCTSCHGPSRQRGGLAMDTHAALMTGGEEGPVVAPGAPQASEILRRLRLPADDDDHMPPPSKPQPTAEQIDALARWIAAGASADAPLPADEREDGSGATPRGSASAAAADAGALAHAPGASAVDGAPPPGSAIREPPPADAVARLQARLVHVETIDPLTGQLFVDFGALPDARDADVIDGLTDLGPHVRELSLGGTAIGDGVLPFVADLDGLAVLDLSGTAVTSDGIAALSERESLVVLNLTGTAVDDDVTDTLAGLGDLRRVYVWGTDVSPAARERLAERRPDLLVEDGRAIAADALESEPALVLEELARLVASNTSCPVSGEPIDPAILVVHEGTVLGFCCSECPARFWADPDAFPAGN